MNTALSNYVILDYLASSLTCRMLTISTPQRRRTRQLEVNKRVELPTTWRLSCLQMRESILSNLTAGPLDVFCTRWLLVDLHLLLKDYKS
jgi:hypothetical protein